MLWWGCRERDYVLDLFEYSSGQRFHPRYFQVGGVIEDIPPGWEQKAREFCALLPDAARPVRGAARPQRDLPPAPEGRRDRRRADAARPGRDRAAAARHRQPVGPAQGDALLVLRPLRLQDPGRHRRRQLRPLPRADGGDARVGEDRRAGARRPARGPLHHRRPQGRAAAAPRAGHLDGGADPPLQARDRGLPRAGRRGLRPDRVAARRARLLRGLATARRSRRACTCATRASRTSSRSSRWARAA